MSQKADLGVLIDEARELERRYRQLTGKPLGVSGEVGEYEAARILGLELAPPRAAGYDATDANGLTYQIKTRALDAAGRKKSQQLGSIARGHTFDVLAVIVLDEILSPVEVWTADMANVEAALNEPGSKARNERRSLSLPKIRQIGQLAWSR